MIVAFRTCQSTPFNSLWPGDTYTRHLTGSSLVQVMACRLFGAKPLPDPMSDYYQLELRDKPQWNFNQFKNFHWRKCIWKCRLRNGAYFVSALMNPVGLGHTVSGERGFNIMSAGSRCPQIISSLGLNTLRPRHMDAISQTTFSKAFSWMKMFELRLKFHWSLFPMVQLAIF